MGNAPGSVRNSETTLKGSDPSRSVFLCDPFRVEPPTPISGGVAPGYPCKSPSGILRCIIRPRKLPWIRVAHNPGFGSLGSLGILGIIFLLSFRKALHPEARRTCVRSNGRTMVEKEREHGTEPRASASGPFHRRGRRGHRGIKKEGIGNRGGRRRDRLDYETKPRSPLESTKDFHRSQKPPHPVGNLDGANYPPSGGRLAFRR